MADAAPADDEPRYQIRVHPRADSELGQLRGETDIEDLELRIDAAARERQPKTHPCVEGLEGADGLLRIKGRGVRAIIALEKPTLLVLAVGKRDGFYQRQVETAERRLADWKRGGSG